MLMLTVKFRASFLKYCNRFHVQTAMVVHESIPWLSTGYCFYVIFLSLVSVFVSCTHQLLVLWSPMMHPRSTSPRSLELLLLYRYHDGQYSFELARVWWPRENGA
jgi:hypothetical protein